MRIFFRADGNRNIGLGHLVRSLALAHILKNNFQITFFCKEIPDSLKAELAKNCFGFRYVLSENDFLNQITENIIVVLDGYHFDIEYQMKIKAKGSKLVCIDDIHNSEFVADLIINHSPGILSKDYKTRSYSQFALGLDYSLLRPSFLKQARKNRKVSKIETLMICFGGSDFKNLTLYTLKIALEFSEFKKIIVIIGAAYQITDKFNETILSDKRIDCRHDLNEEQMLDSMLETDLAIVPSSAILYEVLSAGCLAISGTYVDNQKLIYEYLRDANLFMDAGDFTSNKLNKAISETLKGSYTQTSIIDGYSEARIEKLFNQLQMEYFIKLRPINIADIDLTFGWASNYLVRRFSFSINEISKNEHADWFMRKLTDGNCYFAIVEFESVPIGSIRFDIQNFEAKISYLVDPSYHGKGFGHIVLKKGIEWLIDLNILDSKPIHLLRGDVMKSNVPSIKAFERLGFEMSEMEESYKFEKWI